MPETTNETVDELIYTKNGYIPLSELDSDTQFIDESSFSVIPKLSEEGLLSFNCIKEGHIVCVHTHHLKETGELVKESRHVYLFKGLSMGAELGTLS